MEKAVFDLLCIGFAVSMITLGTYTLGRLHTRRLEYEEKDNG